MMKGRYLLDRRVAQQSSPVLYAQVNAQNFKRAVAFAFTFLEDPHIVPQDKEGHIVEGSIGAGKMFLAGDQRLEDAIDVFNG